MSNRDLPVTVAKPHAMATTAREGFGERSLQQSGEMAVSAQQAQAIAEVHALRVVAMQNPRDWNRVRDRLLSACDRPRFAEAARYRLPYAKNDDGKEVEGLSIRFAEEAMKQMGNLVVRSRVTHDDTRVRKVEISITDLEANVFMPKEVTFQKTVERHNGQNRDVLGERFTSKGHKIFIVAATDEELLQKQNAIESKARRELILSLVPADIKEECEERIAGALDKDDRKNPADAMRRVVEAFATKGIMVADLDAYLGRALGGIVGDDLIWALRDLRGVFSAIREQTGTWDEILAQKKAERGAVPDARHDARGGAAAGSSAPSVQPPSSAPPVASAPAAAAPPPGGDTPAPSDDPAPMTPGEEFAAKITEAETVPQCSAIAPQLAEALSGGRITAAENKKLREQWNAKMKALAAGRGEA